MPSLQDQVRHDAASLHGFVGSISDKCELLNRAVIYPESSERFFTYISQLAAATKTYLQKSLDASQSPGELLGLRDEIATLRSSWRFMHQFVKPALDADTLKLPVCLLDGLKARFRQIPQFSDTDFVFYHSAYLNYFNVKLGVFKPRADQISNLVGGQAFPKQLGLIGIPYSQSASLFVNCLIPHEIGHHAFGELQLAKKFRSDIEVKLITRFGKSLKAEERGKLVELMAFWVEELFCDVFAIRLVGFCFSLAFAELFDTATVLDADGKLEKTRAGIQLLFDQYPPDLFRLRLQASVLKADGWWQRLEERAGSTHYFQTLAAAESLQDNDFIFPQTSINTDETRAVFTEILPSIVTELDAIAGQIPRGAEMLEQTGDLIEEYLENGTVPSTLVPHEELGPRFPTTVALLNASYRFYIKSLSRLVSRIDGAVVNRAADSSIWSKQVEMWTAKAIEDVALLEKKLPFPQKPFDEIGSTDIAPGVRSAVLSRDEIRQRLNLSIDKPESLIITPLLDIESFDQDSVDLRLGTHFLMPQVPPEPYVDMAGHERINPTYLQPHAPLRSYFVLPAHQTVLGATLEFVKLPFDLSGEILTKSSIARTFIMIETAPWIHPSYRGCLTLEIANVSNTAIILYPCTPIGQLVLFHAGVKSPPEKLSGSYLGPIYPEAPNLKAAHQLFEKLGLSKYRRPGHGWIDAGKIKANVRDALGRMSVTERARVDEIIEILQRSGGFPTDSDIAEFVRESARKTT
jgi:dCTP deaminase